MDLSNIPDLALVAGIGLLAVIVVGWVLAIMVAIFLRILDIKIPGQALLSCLSTVLATAITGGCGVVSAALTSGLLLAPTATPIMEELIIEDLREGPVGASALSPTVIIVIVLILVFIIAFLVIRRTLRRSVG